MPRANLGLRDTIPLGLKVFVSQRDSVTRPGGKPVGIEMPGIPTGFCNKARGWLFSQPWVVGPGKISNLNEVVSRGMLNSHNAFACSFSLPFGRLETTCFHPDQDACGCAMRDPAIAAIAYTYTKFLPPRPHRSRAGPVHSAATRLPRKAS